MHKKNKKYLKNISLDKVVVRCLDIFCGIGQNPFNGSVENNHYKIRSYGKATSETVLITGDEGGQL